MGLAIEVFRSDGDEPGINAFLAREKSGLAWAAWQTRTRKSRWAPLRGAPTPLCNEGLEAAHDGAVVNGKVGGPLGRGN